MAKKDNQKKVLLLIGVAAAAYFLFRKKTVRKAEIPTVEYLEEGYVTTDNVVNNIPVVNVPDNLTNDIPVFKVPDRGDVFVSETPVYVTDNNGKIIEQDVYTIDRITHVGVQPVSYAAVSGKRYMRRKADGICSGIMK